MNFGTDDADERLKREIEYHTLCARFTLDQAKPPGRQWTPRHMSVTLKAFQPKRKP